MSVQAVFVDRDGTINRDVHYLDNPDGLELYPSVAESIGLLNQAGLLVVVITNQSGLARGYFDLDTLAEIHSRLRQKLAESGAHFDALYFCPHHPDDGCTCRKPGTALLEKAAAEWSIDTRRSYFIGDRIMDVQAGQAVGCRTILVPERLDLVEEEKKVSHVQADFECKNFSEAVEWILKQEGLSGPHFRACS